MHVRVATACRVFQLKTARGYNWSKEKSQIHRKKVELIRTYVIEVRRCARPRVKDTVGRTKQIIVTNGSHGVSPAEIVRILQVEQAWEAMHISSQAACDATGRFAIRRLTALIVAASAAACQPY